MEPHVDNKNFCILPWTHLYYFTDGYVYPCPKMTTFKQMRLGKTSDSIESLWNSDVLKNLRKEMLSQSGSVPICNSQCNNSINSCKKYVGTELHSQSLNVIASTKEDGSLDTVNYVAWNIPETNVCNFSCLYCNSNYSSAWYKVDHPTESGSIKRTFASPEALRATIDPYMDKVEEIHFASGESVFQESYYYILDELIKRGRQNDPKLRIFFITNMSSMFYKGRNIYELLNRFSNVTILASLDASHGRAEIIRYGSVWKNIEFTRKQIQQYKNLKFYLQPVMSIMNILHFPNFHKDWIEKGFATYDSVRYYVLTSPKEFNIKNLPTEMKAEVTERYSNYSTYLKSLYTSTVDIWPNRELPHTFIDKMIDQMNRAEPTNVSFVSKVREMETKFKFDFFSVFPELRDLSH